MWTVNTRDSAAHSYSAGGHAREAAVAAARSCITAAPSGSALAVGLLLGVLAVVLRRGVGITTTGTAAVSRATVRLTW